jgi:hypothetical protein
MVESKMPRTKTIKQIPIVTAVWGNSVSITRFSVVTSTALDVEPPKPSIWVRVLTTTTYLVSSANQSIL